MVYGLGNNGEITNIVYDVASYNVMKDSFELQTELPDWYDMTKHTWQNGIISEIPSYVQWSEKQSKIKNINTLIVVTVSGKVFDGDEKSQDRMLRAINIASITGQTETQWKLADNSIVMVTLDELKEALALAGQEMSRIWLEN